jgi:glycosyltransferase involved in cell wall biosynthesis
MWNNVRSTTGGTLVIVGDGPELDKLQRLAGPDVEFTGWVDEDRKREELSKAWLLIHPAHHEGWGTVVMEAAAASVPTLAFNVAGVRDSVEDGVTGLLATDAQARAATFTWDRAVDLFEQVLESAVPGR